MRVCFNCGAGDELHDHHVVPRSLGGIATVPLCRVCHGKAHGRQRGFRDIAELTRVALAHLRAEGVVLGGAALGWAHTSKLDAAGRRVITEEAEEAVVVERIHELKAAGASVRRIADILTAEGRATKSGGRWHPTTVQRVLARGTS